MNLQSRRAKGRLIGAGVVVSSLLLLGIVAFQVDRHPRTDDATVRANAIAFAPEVEGRLVKLNVKDNQVVHKGDVLFVIDPRPYEYALQQAKADQATLEGQIHDEERRIASERSAVGSASASVAGSQSGIAAARASLEASKASVIRAQAAKDSAAAQLSYADNDYKRIAPLLAKRYVTVQQVDQVQTALRIAQQNEAQADSQLLEAQAHESMALAAQQSADAGLLNSRSKLGEAEHNVDTLETLIAQRPSRAAKVEQAALNLEWCEVRAPFDGYVANLNISEGAYAHPGTPIFTLIDTTTWWVLANYRESKLGEIHPGQNVSVYLMEHPGRNFHGVVESVGRGVFPEDGAQKDGFPDVDRTLNWVHLSARFPVRIRVTDADPDVFRIGATAVTVMK